MARVRYWAGAKALAHTAEEEVQAPKLVAVLDEARRLHGEPMARLIDVSVILLDGARVPVDQDCPVGADSVIEILPPYAGG